MYLSIVEPSIVQQVMGSTIAQGKHNHRVRCSRQMWGTIQQRCCGVLEPRIQGVPLVYSVPGKSPKQNSLEAQDRPP